MATESFYYKTVGSATLMESDVRQAHLLLAAVTLSFAEEKTPRVEPEVASHNLTKKVEPVVPPLAKLTQVGGTVVVDIIIDSAGMVSSVTLISGHPMLAPAFIDAVKKWEYAPFLKDGNPIPVVTRVEWTVASPKYSQSQEKALRDYYPTFDGCYQLLKQGKPQSAEEKCKEAVTLSDQLPENRVLERSNARSCLGHAFFGRRRFSEALPFYEKAVEIRKTYEHSDRDADFASQNASLARAHAALGNLSEADRFYSQAVAIFKAAIANLPEMKDNYSARLKSTLVEYSRLKSARGDRDEADELEKEANQI
jgi:TonB family protein